MKLSEAIADLINWCAGHVVIVELEQKVSRVVRKLARGGLDLLQNLLIVGLFQYFAERTKSPFLWAIAAFRYMALLAYYSAFLHVWVIRFDAIKWPWVRFVAYMALNIAVIGMLWFVITFGIAFSIKDLMKAQTP